MKTPVTIRVATSACPRASGKVLLGGLVLFCIAGCRPAPVAFPASLNSQRPDERVRAAKQAVGYPYASPAERRVVLELLVARLDDEDPAVRFFAIMALEKMTGTRQGYVYHAPLDERLRSIQAWRRYVAREGDAAPNKAVKPESAPPVRPSEPPVHKASGIETVPGGAPK